MNSEDISHRPSSLDFSASNTNILKAGIQNVHVRNWAETYQCWPELFFAPKTVDDIEGILKFAREENKKVRTIGCRHSPSDIAFTNEIMISLQNFNKVLEVDRSKLQVKVQAGMIISDLNDWLYSHNLALSTLGSVSDITIGGALSVGTHGTGIKYGTLSSYVTELEMILSDGNKMTLSSESGNLFLAAVCSLGSFGIILTVTLQCEIAYNLHLKQYGLELKDVIENLDVHIQGSEHFKFFWFPYTDGVTVFHSSRTELPANKDSWLRKLWSWFWDYAIGYYTLELLLYVSTFFPQIGPSINRFYYNFLYSMSSSRINCSHKIFNYDCLFKQYVNEWAIPIDKTGVVLWQLKEWIESLPGIYVHFPLEVRFVKAENILISPAYGRDTCYINIIMYRPYGKTVPYEEYWTAYENIMFNAGGRPHWAKAHKVTAEQFNSMYPAFGMWCKIRQKLDPISMFFNPYMSRIFSSGKN